MKKLLSDTVSLPLSLKISHLAKARLVEVMRQQASTVADEQAAQTLEEALRYYGVDDTSKAHQIAVEASRRIGLHIQGMRGPQNIAVHVNHIEFLGTLTPTEDFLSLPDVSPGDSNVAAILEHLRKHLSDEDMENCFKYELSFDLFNSTRMGERTAWTFFISIIKGTSIRRTPPTGARAAQSTVPVTGSRVAGAVKVLFAEAPAKEDTFDTIEARLREQFGEDVELVREYPEGGDQAALRAMIAKHQPAVIVLRSKTTSFNAAKKGGDEGIFEFAKDNGVKVLMRAG
ncbi:MAG: hypothetical protein HQL11_06505, partial [Candidatus Omnitrophica bacterium]|nr:hypothetical protein [Candidatus Omnitrophota bacterium]